MPFGPWPGGGGGGGGGPVTTGLQVDPWRRADQLTLVGDGWEISTVAATGKDPTDPELWIAIFPDSGSRARGTSTQAPIAAVQGADATKFHFKWIWRAANVPSGDFVRWNLNYQVLRAGAAPAGWTEIDLGEIENSDDVLPNEAEEAIDIGAGPGEIDVQPGDRVYLQIARSNVLEHPNVVGDVYLFGLGTRWSA